MALTSTARGSGSHGTGATSWVITPASYPAAGNLLVLVVAYDNSGTSGADPYSSITDSKSNTWTSRHNTLRDPSTASSGCVLRIFTTRQNAGTLVSADTITISLGTSTVAKAWALWEITAASGYKADYLATGTGAGGATTTPSVTTGTIVVGDMTVGGVAYEYGQAPATSDTDTTNGSWSTRQNANVGSTTSGMSVCTQTKLQTTADSAQTYNPTYTNSSDWAAGWISVDEVSLLQSLTIGVIDAVPAVYSLTVVKAPYPITLGLIDGAPAIYALTVMSLQSLTLPCVGSSDYYSRVVTDAPVLNWRLGEEDTATVAYDSAGSYNGTYSYAPTHEPGALLGDGNQSARRDAALCVYHGSFDTPMSALTYEIWFKTTLLSASRNYGLIDQSTPDTSHYGPALFVRTTYADFEINGVACTANVSANDGRWHHVVGTFDSTVNGGTTTIYVDGKVGSQYGSRGSITTIGTQFDVGFSHYWGWSFLGSLDEVAVYDRALSLAEVKEHFSAGSGVFALSVEPDQFLTLDLISTQVDMPPEVVQWYRLGEPSGTVAVDSRGWMNDGTYVGSPTLGVPGALRNSADTAVTLDGISQCITMGGIYSGGPAADPFTFSMWVNHTPDSTWRSLICYRLVSDGSAMLLASHSSGLAFIRRSTAGGTDQAVGPALIAGWHHVVGVFDSSYLRLYVDGSLVAGPIASSQDLGYVDEAYIGSGDGYFNGSIDEVSIVAGAWSAGQVLTTYYSGVGQVAPLAISQLASIQSLTIGVIDAAPAVYSLTVVKAPYPITLGLIDGGATVYSLSVRHVISLGLIDGGPTVYTLVVPLPTAPIILGLIDGGPTVYSLTVVATALTVVLGFTDGGATVYSLTVTLAAYVIDLDCVVSPGVSEAEGTPYPYALTVTQSKTFIVGLIDGGATVYSLTVAKAAYVIDLDCVDSPGVWDNEGTAIPYDLIVSYDQYLVLGLIDGGPTVYSLSVVFDQLVVLGLIDADRVMYSLWIYIPGPPQDVILGVIVSVRAIYNLKVKQRYNLHQQYTRLGFGWSDKVKPREYRRL